MLIACLQIRVVSAFRSGMDSRKNSTTDAGALGRSASKRTPHMHPNAAAATASTSADVIKDAANDKKNSAHNETPVWTMNFRPLRIPEHQQKKKKMKQNPLFSL